MPAQPAPAARGASGVPRVSEDTDPESERTRADAMPGMAEVLKKLAKPAPKAEVGASFGVVPDVGADLDPPSAEDAATRAIPREDLMRAPDSRVVFDNDVGGYEATLAVPFPSSSGQGGEKIAAALAEALQQQQQQASAGGMPGAASLSFLGKPRGESRPPMAETLQTPQYPAGVPPPAPAPVLPASARFPNTPGAGFQPALFAGPMPGASYPGGSRPPVTAPMAAAPLAAPWLQQGGVPPAPSTGPSYGMPMPHHPHPAASPSGKKQVLLVVLVGVVCLTIFVVGVVLFLTTF